MIFFFLTAFALGQMERKRLLSSPSHPTKFYKYATCFWICWLWDSQLWKCPSVSIEGFSSGVGEKRFFEGWNCAWIFVLCPNPSKTFCLGTDSLQGNRSRGKLPYSLGGSRGQSGEKEGNSQLWKRAKGNTHKTQW